MYNGGTATATAVMNEVEFIHHMTDDSIQNTHYTHTS